MRRSWVLATITCLAVPGESFAQRADENAVTAAQDAFGTSIGQQNVGLYSQSDARGFSPQDAGNLRVEGLYFDRQTWVTSDCMVRETTMRVGIAAQSYAFPAPTGIADFSLRTPREKTLFSAVLSRGPFDSATADLEAQIPLTEQHACRRPVRRLRREFRPRPVSPDARGALRGDLPLATGAEHRDPSRSGRTTRAGRGRSSRSSTRTAPSHSRIFSRRIWASRIGPARGGT